ncbi:MAG: PorV/PorQ family protein [Candidatus Fermentibacteraceae bacterium]|nr:PorV/PorQ family protein [Candidatus Fermentibacteraceae bacterium]
MKLTCTLVLFAFLAASAGGTAGFAFLQIPAGARAVAMGGAFTAVPGDPISLYWNPAASANLKESELTTTYTSYMMDMQAGFAGWVNPGENAVIGVSLNYFYGGSFDRTTMEDPLGTGEQFSSNSMALAGTWAKPLSESISLGATGRFIYSQIDSYNANGFSVDIGGMYTPSALPGFAGAIVVRNAGVQTKAFYSENDPMPTEIAAGVSQALLNDNLLVAADATMPLEGDFDFAAGIEYKPVEMLALRTGWSLSAKDTADNAGGGLIDAMGFGMGTSYDQFSLDYTWKPCADLGNTHRISLGMNI